MTGSERNGLAGARSPFLQHGATQPVDWLPWGEAAFARSRAEDRPILLDIGAVWCHWCHVMDRESYEDAQTAALINELFVPVKVDRDELPDVDARYQRAVQLLTGQGGWPLTAFLTPDGEVFYGGTYFPPDERFGRPSFQRVLAEVARVWRAERTRALDAAHGIEERLAAYAEGESAPGVVQPALVADTVEELARSFDFRYGGFGGAPKFPNPGALDLLLDAWLDERADWTRRMLIETLEAMARGGIHDQLGGGFHRYATDARWLVPHFEKMAYDNGPLLSCYARAYAATGAERFRRVADGIIAHYREVAPALLERGGFPASQDADVGPDDDGDYWTWTEAELRAALGDGRPLEIASLHFGLHDAGAQMHLDPNRRVLFEALGPEPIATHLGMRAEEVEHELTGIRRRLREVRAQRPRPYVDETQYAGWVALVASGFLAAARYCDRPDAARDAVRALERLLAAASDDRAVPHALAAGTGELLEDQAFFVQALLDAYEALHEERWLGHARTQADVLLARFREPERGALLDRPADADDVAKPLARPLLPVTDSPTPSGNGTAALVLLRLWALTGDDAARATAERILGAFAGSAGRLGSAAATYVKAVAWLTRDATHIVVVGDGPAADALLAEATRTYRPRTVIRAVRAADAARAELPPEIRAMLQVADGVRAYVCVGRSCHAPVSRVEELRALLAPGAESGGAVPAP